MNHHKSIRIFLFILLLGFLSPATQAQTFFTGNFSVEQAGSDMSSLGVGTAAMALTDEGLRFYVTVDGLTGPLTAAHFHDGSYGESGPPVRTITDDFDGQTAMGVWTASDDEPLTQEMMDALFAGGLYINIHTEAYPGGEIRAQVVPSSGTLLSATLTPEAQVHGVESDASGTATVQLTPAGAIYHLTVTGLTGSITIAHFHEGRRGVAGGIVRTITDDFDGNTAFGIWTASDDEPLDMEQWAALLTGGLYLNIHTDSYAPGELRGQVELRDGWALGANLNAEQEVPGSESDGSGTAYMALTDAGLHFFLTAASLTGPITAAHFHMGAEGTDGPPVRTITDDFAYGGHTAYGVWSAYDDEPLTDDLIGALAAGDIYINIHTDEYPAGEIRGQVLPLEGAQLGSRLTPMQNSVEMEEMPAGTALLSVGDEGAAFYVTVEGLTGPITAAHFHMGATGVNGPPVRTITDDFSGQTASGVWTATDDEPLTQEMMAALFQGGLYLNIHTDANPGGEIRGQVLPVGGAGLTAPLTSAQENHDVDGDATGSALVQWTPEGILFDVTVDGLSGDITAAHFHRGAAGTDGPPVRTITDDFSGWTARGMWTATDEEQLTLELVGALFTGELYLNVHTALNAPGEVRGQVHVAGAEGIAVALDTEQSVSKQQAAHAQGTASISLTPAGLVYTTTVAELTGPITAAHFHRGARGATGPPVHTISFEDNTATGFWSTTFGAEALTIDDVIDLYAGNIYLNVHTDENPGGEIRGQVDAGMVVSTASESDGLTVLPDRIRLDQNYPNPFNPATRIGFELEEPMDVSIDVFDVQGRRVGQLASGVFQSGRNEVVFNAAGLPSGTYFAVMTTSSGVDRIKMMLLK